MSGEVKTVYQIGEAVEFKENDIISGLQMRHDEVLRLVFLGTLSTAEIAERCRLTPDAVRKIIKSPYGQKRLKLLRSVKDYNAVELTMQVQISQKDAICTVKDCMLTADTDSTRLKAALAILEMGGFYNKKETTVVHKHLSSDQLDTIKEIAGATSSENEILTEVSDNDSQNQEYEIIDF